MREIKNIKLLNALATSGLLVRMQESLTSIVRSRMCWITVVAAFLIYLPLAATPVHALTINVSGTLADHDGDGNNNNETAALNQSIADWEARILTNRTFNLTVVSQALTGFGTGGVTNFNASDIPTDGTIRMATNQTWSLAAQSSYTLHADSNEHHRHFVGGPTTGADFLSVINQEIGHAMGW